jgi:hypothetical protein
MYTPTTLFANTSAAVGALVCGVWAAQPNHSIKSVLIASTVIIGLTFVYWMAIAFTSRSAQPTSAVIAHDATTYATHAQLERARRAVGTSETIHLAAGKHWVFYYLALARIIISTALVVPVLLGAWYLVPGFPLHLLIGLVVITLSIGALRGIKAHVFWESWCFVVTAKQIRICVSYPPELFVLSSTVASVDSSSVTSSGTTIPGWASAFTPPPGDVTLETPAQQDGAFHEVCGLPDPKTIKRVIDNVRK